MADIHVTTTFLRISQGDRLVALVNMTPSQWAALANDAQRMAREGAKPRSAMGWRAPPDDP